MKELEKLLNKMESEMDSKQNETQKKYNEFDAKLKSESEKKEIARLDSIKKNNLKKIFSFLKLIGCAITALISYQVGIVGWDGGLFTGLIMQSLLIVSSIATIGFLIQFLVVLFKNVDD